MAAQAIGEIAQTSRLASQVAHVLANVATTGATGGVRNDPFDTGDTRAVDISLGTNSPRDRGPSEPYAQSGVLPKRNIVGRGHAIIQACGL